MFTARNRDGGEILAGRSILEHMAARAERMGRDRPEEAEFRAVLARPLCARYQIWNGLFAIRTVGSRPAVATVAADDRAREAGIDRHDGERNRQDLAGAAIVQRGAECGVDAKTRRDQLVI